MTDILGKVLEVVTYLVGIHLGVLIIVWLWLAAIEAFCERKIRK